MSDRILNMPLDYLSCSGVVLLLNTGEGWYMTNWLYYSFQTENFFLIWMSYMKVSCSFFHFLHSNVSDNKCHKQKWCMLFFTCIKLAIHVLVCACAFSDIKWRRLHIIFIYLLALFILKNLKKFLQQIQSYEDAAFLGPKWPICPNDNSSGNPVNKSCSFHLCLCTCQKSMSDINLLMKYWQLKNTEISLAKSHFLLKPEDQIFPKHVVFQKC